MLPIPQFFPSVPKSPSSETASLGQVSPSPPSCLLSPVTVAVALPEIWLSWHRPLQGDAGLPWAEGCLCAENPRPPSLRVAPRTCVEGGATSGAQCPSALGWQVLEVMSGDNLAWGGQSPRETCFPWNLPWTVSSACPALLAFCCAPGFSVKPSQSF